MLVREPKDVVGRMVSYPSRTRVMLPVLKTYNGVGVCDRSLLRISPF